jgi:c-di-GMP-binding flagellar brake protein YcgR
MNIKQINRGTRLLLLPRDQIATAVPLEQPIFDTDGALIVNHGEIMPSDTDREFLFKHFQPHVAVLGEPETSVPSSGASASAFAQPPVARPATTREFGVDAGSRLRLRLPAGMGSRFASSRVIGSMPQQALFITPPMIGRRPARFLVGEALDLLGFSGRTIHEFECILETVGKVPSDYLVLSWPTNIRQVKLRTSVRVAARLAAWISLAGPAQAPARGKSELLGVILDLSVAGASLAARKDLARAGDRLRLRFHVRAEGFDMEISTAAVVRNVAAEEATDICTYGIQFDTLQPLERITLRCFVYENEGNERS